MTRVLHIVENFNGQAVESWLLRLLRTVDGRRPDLHWTFFCTVAKPSAMDDEVRRLGSEVIHSQREISRPLSFISSLRGVMRGGGYDVLHCHHDIMSAPALIASAGRLAVILPSAWVVLWQWFASISNWGSVIFNVNQSEASCLDLPPSVFSLASRRFLICLHEQILG